MKRIPTRPEVHLDPRLVRVEVQQQLLSLAELNVEGVNQRYDSRDRLQTPRYK